MEEIYQNMVTDGSYVRVIIIRNTDDPDTSHQLVEFVYGDDGGYAGHALFTRDEAISAAKAVLEYYRGV